MFLKKDFILKDRYKITEKTDCSGSTAIYFALDTSENKRVKIKEFFPTAIMQREVDGSVSAKPECEVKYKSLKSDFYELYDYIMSIAHIGGILAPREVFYENGTCYAVEDLCSCETLEDFLARNEGELNWQTIKKAVSPIISALRKMHSDGFYHRGISPENIIIKDASMLLTGFDIPPARTNESEIDSTLYFGFSAPEQYSSAAWQGSWTDVYSTAAICYRALTGITPVEWRQRGSRSKNLIPPSSLNPSCPENVSNTLLTALSVDIRNRYRTIEDFWMGLLHGAGDTTIVVHTPKMQGHIKKLETDAVRVSEPDDTRVLEKPPTAAKPAVSSNNSSNNIFLYSICAALAVAVAVLSGIIITFMIKDKAAKTQSEVPESSISSEVNNEESSPEESEESQMVLMPPFIGKSVEEVMMNKRYTSLYNFEIERAYSEIYPVGNVVDQYPAPGTEYDKNNNTVILLISMGSERTTMPLVEGTPFDQAVLLLNGLGIEYKVEEINDSMYTDGTVIKASIPFGTTIMRTRDTVTLTVASSAITSSLPYDTEAED